MVAVTHLRCEECRAALLVVPAAAQSLLRSEEPDEGELEELTGIENQRFALADAGGRFTCPECGGAGRVPQLRSS